MTLPTLTLLECRVLGVLVEKEHTVPDIYPLSLNALTAGCNQKNNRDPVLNATEGEVQAAIDRLKPLSFVIESSGSRVMRYSQNVASRAARAVRVGCTARHLVAARPTDRRRVALGERAPAPLCRCQLGRRLP